MVKNTVGGNKSKGFARKLLNAKPSNSIRVPLDPLEQFAVVTKLYGTICDVTTDGINNFKCHIRGKFRGRSKRNSITSIGKLIMIGFRDFEAPQYKNTDLLEIYDSQDINILLNKPDIHISPLILFAQNILNPISNTNDSSIDFIFSNTTTTSTINNDIIEYQDTMNDMDNTQTISFDDI